MRLNNLVWILGLSVIGSALFPISAQAVTLSKIGTDQEMNDLFYIKDGKHDLSFVAEGRIGDRAGAATFELDLHEDDPGKIQVSKQYNWLNNVATAFELVYQASTKQVTYKVGGTQTLSYNYTDSFSDIFIRTRSLNNTSTTSSLLVNNLKLNGVDLFGESLANANDNTDILRISGLSSNQDFTLTGTSTMTWSGTQPRNSNLAYQIKVAKTKKVPESSTLIGLVLGGAIAFSVVKSNIKKIAN